MDDENVESLDISNRGGEERYELLDFPYSWQLDEGILRYAGVQSVIFWAPTSLAEFLAGMHRIAGDERYGYILPAQGRRSEQDDWNFISSFLSISGARRERVGGAMRRRAGGNTRSGNCHPAGFVSLRVEVPFRSPRLPGRIAKLVRL